MRLYDELFKNAEGNSFTRCTIIPLGGGYFEGVKSVGDFTPNRLEIWFAKEKVVIDGEDFSIRKYCDGDLQMDGKIYRLQVEKLPKDGV